MASVSLGAQSLVGRDRRVGPQGHHPSGYWKKEDVKRETDGSKESMQHRGGYENIKKNMALAFWDC